MSPRTASDFSHGVASGSLSHARRVSSERAEALGITRFSAPTQRRRGRRASTGSPTRRPRARRQAPGCWGPQSRTPGPKLGSRTPKSRSLGPKLGSRTPNPSRRALCVGYVRLQMRCRRARARCGADDPCANGAVQAVGIGSCIFFPWSSRSSCAPSTDTCGSSVKASPRAERYAGQKRSARSCSEQRSSASRGRPSLRGSVRSRSIAPGGVCSRRSRPMRGSLEPSASTAIQCEWRPRPGSWTCSAGDLPRAQNHAGAQVDV